MGGPGSGRRKKITDAAIDHAVATTTGPMTPQTVIPSIGTVPLTPLPLTPSESMFVSQLQSGLKKAFIGNKNPMWNDEEELELSRNVAFTVNPTAGGNIAINPRFSKRYPVADLNIPRAPEAVIQLSLRYALENPFVAKALRIKADFTCKNFQHKTHKDEAKTFYDNFARQIHLRSQLPKICWNLFATGLCPIYWGGEEGGTIKFMQVLNPAAVHIEDVMGVSKMWLKVTPAMVDAVKDPTGSKDPRNKLQYDSMPKYWITQLEALIKKGSGQGLIALADGSYTVVDYRYAPYNRAENTLDGVPLQGAFDALQRYRLLSAGDFAVAWNVKNMLTLISEGDPKADTKDYKPADNVRLQKLQQNFSHPDYALTIFCDPTTQVRYVVPPLEVFDPKKYTQVEKEIKDVLNIPSFMWNNDGSGTYGAAQAEVQLLRQEVQAVRMLLEDQLFYPLYVRARLGAKKPGFAAADIPMPQFDQNSLRDDSIWLSANEQLYNIGAISLETLLEVFGYDLDYEAGQKKHEHETLGDTDTTKTPMRPLFNPGGQDVNEDKGGRPSDGSGEQESPHRNPRRSGK